MTGIELLRKLSHIDFNIIFTTAYDEYAIDAIRFSALDYLLKPIDADELRAAVDKFMMREVVHMGQKAIYGNLMHNLNVKDKRDFKLALSTTEGTYFFNPEEIIRLEGENNYTKFFFTNKKNLVISRTLKEYEELLNAHGFIRTHKSHLINKRHVVTYDKDGMLTMKDTSKVEISRRRKEEVLEALKSGNYEL
jgi:two-component system LytT family response regulator